jgi:hypothetical protein
MLNLTQKQLEFLIIVDMQGDWHRSYFIDAVIPILYEDALMVQEIKNEPPRAPSTPRNKKLRDLAQLHKETVSESIMPAAKRSLLI